MSWIKTQNVYQLRKNRAREGEGGKGRDKGMEGGRGRDKGMEGGRKGEKKRWGKTYPVVFQEWSKLIAPLQGSSCVNREPFTASREQKGNSYNLMSHVGSSLHITLQLHKDQNFNLAVW